MTFRYHVVHLGMSHSHDLKFEGEVHVYRRQTEERRGCPHGGWAGAHIGAGMSTRLIRPLSVKFKNAEERGTTARWRAASVTYRLIGRGLRHS